MIYIIMILFAILAIIFSIIYALHAISNLQKDVKYIEEDIDRLYNKIQ